jgi:hypothetical protein
VKNKAAQQLGKKGGKTTKKKYGREHFQNLGKLSGAKRRKKKIST